MLKCKNYTTETVFNHVADIVTINQIQLADFKHLLSYWLEMEAWYYFPDTVKFPGDLRHSCPC